RRPQQAGAAWRQAAQPELSQNSASSAQQFAQISADALRASLRQSGYSEAASDEIVGRHGHPGQLRLLQHAVAGARADATDFYALDADAAPGASPMNSYSLPHGSLSALQVPPPPPPINDGAAGAVAASNDFSSQLVTPGGGGGDPGAAAFIFPSGPAYENYGAAVAAAAAAAAATGGVYKRDVEVPESLIGVVLGPGGRDIAELQTATHTCIQVSKRGRLADTVAQPCCVHHRHEEFQLQAPHPQANVLKAERVIQQRVTQEDQRRKHPSGGVPPLLSCRGPHRVGCNLAAIVAAILQTNRWLQSCNYRWLQSCNYRWLQSCTGNPVRCYVSPQASAEGGRAAPAIRSFLMRRISPRLFLCAVCFDWPVFHSTDQQRHACQRLREPQRQVVYEPCVRPSELLRRQRLPTEASAEQPTGCWPATRQFVVGLDCCDAGDGASSACCSSSSSFHSASHRSTPVGGISAKAAAVTAVAVCHLGCIRSLAASAAAAPAAAACETLVAVRLWLPGLQSPLPPPAESPPTPPSRDQRRRQEALCGSGLAGRPRAPEAGFYNGFRVAGELLLLLLSVPLLLLLHCLLLLSGIGGQPALLQADWLQFLNRKKSAFWREFNQRRLSRLQLREGRVLLAPAPVEAGAPAGAHPGAADLLREEAERQQQDEQQRARTPPPVSVGLRLVNTPSQTVLLPASEASSLPVRAAASAALLTICRLTAPRLRSTARSAFSCNLPLHLALLCSQLHLALLCSQLHLALLCSQLHLALLCSQLHLALLSALSFHLALLSALSFTWALALLSASPAGFTLALLCSQLLCSQLHLALLCSQLHLALLCSQLHLALLCSQLQLLSASPGTALSRSPGTALFASATVAPAVAVPAAQKPPGVGVAQRLGLSSRRQVGVGGVSQRPRPESPSQRPAQKTSSAKSADELRLVVLQPADVGPDDAQGRLSGVLAGPSLRGPDEGLVLKVSQPFTSARWNSSLNWRAKPGTMAPSLRSSGPKLRERMERRQLRDGRSLWGISARYRGRQGSLFEKGVPVQAAPVPEDLQSIGVGSNVADEGDEVLAAHQVAVQREVQQAVHQPGVAAHRQGAQQPLPLGSGVAGQVALPHEVPHRLRVRLQQPGSNLLPLSRHESNRSFASARQSVLPALQARFSAMGCSSLEGWGGKNT
uniref:KH domain-containing protein n=1 Tax=Macrostomum lignano TaxID=282301 RepID=A0A1I8F9F4_9PLAT